MIKKLSLSPNASTLAQTLPASVVRRYSSDNPELSHKNSRKLMDHRQSSVIREPRLVLSFRTRVKVSSVSREKRTKTQPDYLQQEVEAKLDIGWAQLLLPGLGALNQPLRTVKQDRKLQQVSEPIKKSTRHHRVKTQLHPQSRSPLHQKPPITTNKKLSLPAPPKNHTSRSFNKSNSSVIETPESKAHQLYMNEFAKYFSEQKLEQQLSIYSEEKQRQSMRIYREDLQKVISHRYGRDRISSFLELQYIEDYDSLHSKMLEIFKFTREEVLIFVFIILNQSRSGLLTAEDLVALVGAKRERTQLNHLVMEDVHRIMRYLAEKHKYQEEYHDVVSQRYNYLKEDSLTLVKYRIINYQRHKRETMLDWRKGKGRAIDSKMSQHLYTLANPNEDENKKQGTKNAKMISNLVLLLLNGKRQNPIERDQRVACNFSINFETFKSIFQDRIPFIFVDFLYLLGGIELPEHKYVPIDASVLRNQPVAPPEVYKKKEVESIRKMIRQLRGVYKQLPTVLHY